MPGFPYDRTGFENHNDGRQVAAFVAGQDQDFMQKQGDDGTWVYKANGFISIEDEAAPRLDGFLSYGFEGGIPKVRGSQTARGLFALRGEAPGSGSYVPSLGTLGDGRAFVTTPTGETTEVDFLGNDATQTTFERAVTRDGKSFDPLSPGIAVQGASSGTLGTAPGGVALFGGGAWADGARTCAWAVDEFNAEIAEGDPGQYQIGFYRDGFGNGAPLFKSRIQFEHNQIIRLCSFARVGPKAFLAMTCGMMATENLVPLEPYDAAQAPLLKLFLSVDNGVTWTEVPMPFFSSELDDWDARRAISGTFYNDLVLYSRFSVTPHLGDEMIVQFHLPVALPGPSFPTVLTVIKARFFVSSGTFAVIDRQNYYNYTTPGAPDFRTNAYAYFERGILAITDGFLVQRPSDAVNYKTAPFLIGFSADGTEPATWEASPGPAAAIGQLLWLGAGKVAATIFDGEYGLYESVDRGASWQKRAVVSPETTPPTYTTTFGSNSVMSSFGVLNWLRFDQRAVSMTPARKWFSDDRITPP